MSLNIEKKLKIRFFWNSRTIRIPMQGKKTMTSYLKVCLHVLCFQLRFWWRKSNWWWLRIKSLNLERNQFKMDSFDNLNFHKSAAWINTRKLLIELSSARGKFLTEILAEEIILVFNEKYELDCPDTSIKLNNSWKVFDCPDDKRRIRNIGFSTESSFMFKKVKLLIGTLMAQIKPIVFEEKLFKFW